MKLVALVEPHAKRTARRDLFDCHPLSRARLYHDFAFLDLIQDSGPFVE